MRLEAAAVVVVTSSAFLPCDDDLVMFELGVFVLLPAKFGVDLWMEEFLANKLLEDDLVDRGIEGVLEVIFDDTFPPAVLGFDLEFRGFVGGDLDANCDDLLPPPLLIDVVELLVDLVLLLL